MDQIRIVKEMRERDRRNGRTGEHIRPRFMVWENVPGAFSSNKGEDFRIVLEETAKVSDENASIPRPEKGKWSTSGCILEDWWSISWRVLDAQFWGVPQRRRRIALIADFGGLSAPEILFVRNSVSRDIEQGKEKRKETSGDSGKGSGGSFHALVFENNSKDSRYKGPLNVCPTIGAKLGTGGNNSPFVVDDTAYGIGNGQSSGVYHHIIRILTPIECERLQGFPDGWSDIGEWVDSKGKKHKPADSPRYKALGNSIAIPPWKWVIKRLCSCYERDATMASLFDGIGGFPFIWEQINGKGSCIWSSEVEEFCIAVTKRRINGED